mmetsp:Transcript_29666/g.52107  ORF Transcript_29666/g.52107 Transcript_29666/m.52107 type:complete len:81 (+) Transcript_29666:61-303(+)
MLPHDQSSPGNVRTCFLAGVVALIDAEILLCLRGLFTCTVRCGATAVLSGVSIQVGVSCEVMYLKCGAKRPLGEKLHRFP